LLAKPRLVFTQIGARRFNQTPSGSLLQATIRFETQSKGAAVVIEAETAEHVFALRQYGMAATNPKVVAAEGAWTNRSHQAGRPRYRGCKHPDLGASYTRELERRAAFATASYRASQKR
jgi:hypothetical protein